MPSAPMPLFRNAGATETGADGVRARGTERDPPSALDFLLAVLKTPALAEDLAVRGEVWSEIKHLAELHRFSGWLAYTTTPWLPSSERPWRDQVLTAHHRRHALQLLNL